MQHNTFNNYIDLEKQRLIQYLSDDLQQLVTQLLPQWHNRQNLNQILSQSFQQESSLQSCQHLYLVDTKGIQISANISKMEIDENKYGQDLSQRPYLKEHPAGETVWLSEVYVNQLDSESCITAVLALQQDDNLLGYLIADFSLLSLPVSETAIADRRVWLQVKGDPAIRGTLFQQSRIHSLVDENIDDTIDILDELMKKRGIFHAKLHFSSARISLWLFDDPYRYRIHQYDELRQSCLAYPPRPYPEQASVAKDKIKTVFQQFKTLRFMDDTIYLRAGSLNIINGMVSLNFSCDGTHYLPMEEFLAKPDFYLS